MAYESTAELARRQYELAKGRAESARDLRLGTIGRTYMQGARSLEAGLEGRGILRSGEANRRRVEYGAEEKAAREAAMQQGEYDINQAALDYASELARLQALGYRGGSTSGGGGGSTSPGLGQAPAVVPNIPGSSSSVADSSTVVRPERVNPATVGGAPADWAAAIRANPVLGVRPGTTPARPVRPRPITTGGTPTGARYR